MIDSAVDVSVINKLVDFKHNIFLVLFIICQLIKSFEHGDLERKNSIIQFCSHYLHDNQFKKIYKACEKYLIRRGHDITQFQTFLYEDL